MTELRQLFVDLGHTDARTYIQSGNVVFGASFRSPAKAAREIATTIEHDLGVKCSVLLRTSDDLDRVLSSNPYIEKDPSTLHVAFLDTPPKGDLVVPKGETAEFTVAGRELYLHYPDGYGRTKLSNTYIEKQLGVVATTRNWNTVRKLHQLATED